MKETLKEPYFYVENWNKFRKYCEQRAEKANCHINNKGWNKLKEYHLEMYLKEVTSPFGFLFKIKFRHPEIYRTVKCMPKFYCRYARLKQKELATNYHHVVTYPTWRKKNVN